jgi:uncharacterized protein (DUF4415 family)
MSTQKISNKRMNNLKKLSEMSDDKIDYSEIPELKNEFWKNASIEFPKKKKAVSIRLDPEIVIWYKSQYKEYQTAINAVLKSYMKAHEK